MADTGFYVEFVRPGGMKLSGRLLAVLKGGTKVDFVFDAFQGKPVYTIDLKTGEPAFARHRGAFSIPKDLLPELRDSIKAFGTKEKCFVCGGPAFNSPVGKPPPKELRRDGKYVWCCGGCRQPELPTDGHTKIYPNRR
jgi:hypothetical protein